MYLNIISNFYRSITVIIYAILRLPKASAYFLPSEYKDEKKITKTLEKMFDQGEQSSW